jgi:hypothetical protein
MGIDRGNVAYVVANLKDSVLVETLVESLTADQRQDITDLKAEFVLLKSGMDPDELLSVGADGSFEWKSELDNIVLDASMNGGYF